MELKDVDVLWRQIMEQGALRMYARVRACVRVCVCVCVCVCARPYREGELGLLQHLRQRVRGAQQQLLLRILLVRRCNAKNHRSQWQIW
jgi:hypothetical protein